MRELSPQNEKLMQDFQAALVDIRCPADMFPPDSLGGDREPRNPILPTLLGCECIKLARVYDLEATRHKILGKSARLITRIDGLTSV